MFNPDDGFRNYRQLREKIAEKFDDVSQAAGHKLQCKKSCSGCCVRGLSISRVEFDYIQTSIRADQKIQDRLSTLHVDAKTNRCSFLDENNLCSIYYVRPVLCMSHGAPIVFEQERVQKTDICPLNQEALSQDMLDQGAFFNIDTVNTMLASINMVYAGEESDERFLLDIDNFDVPEKEI